MKKFKISVMFILAICFLGLNIPVYAYEYVKENPYATYFGEENNQWVRVQGEDHGIEPGMSAQSNAYAIVGENDEYIFAFIMEHYTDYYKDNINFDKCGLYTNEEIPQLIYELPYGQDELVAEVSIDGSVVWFYNRSTVYQDTDGVIMSQVVMSRYENGKLTNKIRLKDLPLGKRVLKDTSNGCYWAHLAEDTNDFFHFDIASNNYRFSVNKHTGEILSYGLNFIYPAIAIIVLLIVSFVVICKIRRKKSSKILGIKNT